MRSSRVSVERVRSPQDRRHTSYWLWRFDGKSAGAVSPQPFGSHTPTHWCALGYGKSTPGDNVELGMFDTRAEAETAVKDYIATREDLCP
jgi:hypothetical protein